MRKDWIKRLPPGEYSMKEILEFAGLVRGPSAKIILLKYGAECYQIPLNGRNFKKDMFIWKGFKPVKINKNKEK